MIREGGDGGRREPDLGCDVELVDEADLLGELLAGVGGQVLTHQLQELRGFQAATVHLSARAGSRISTAKWKRRDWRRKTQEEDEGACSVGKQSCGCGKQKAIKAGKSTTPTASNPRRAGMQARPRPRPRHAGSGWVGAMALSGWLAVSLLAVAERRAEL